MTDSIEGVMIIGKPGTSKTTFLAQLYSVLEGRKGRMKLRKAPADFLAITEARQSLSHGQSVPSTPSQSNQVLILNTDLGDRPLDLIIPDYGGEQVNSIIRDRHLEDNWIGMCKSCNTWLLFIRLHDHEEPHDVLTKSSTEVELSTSNGADSNISIINESVELVELLQMLLAARDIGIKIPIVQPKLRLVLTLWDKLNTKERPEAVLSQRYPLLLNFARSNWVSTSMEVWGLSAQGFDLNTQENQDKYLDYTPEEHAYVILPTGRDPIHDLSLLFD